MAQIREAEGQVEVNCDADKFFDVWSQKTPQLSNMSPHVSKIELVEGHNCHSRGAILSWTFVNPLDGKHECAKSKLEDVDEKRRSLSYTVIEGDLMNRYYNTWKERVEVIPKGKNCSIVKYSVECEKKSEDAPEPQVYMDFTLNWIKDISRGISCA